MKNPNSDFFVDDIEEDIIITKQPLQPFALIEEEKDTVKEMVPFEAADKKKRSVTRGNSLLFEEETLQIK